VTFGWPIERPELSTLPRVTLRPPNLEEEEPASPQPPQSPGASPPGYGPLDVELGLVPPSPQLLFRPETEAAYFERLRLEAAQQNITLVFPKDTSPAVPPAPVLVRSLAPPQCAAFVPTLICHRPLYFEDRIVSRYGWHFPCLQPDLSTARFYLDTLLLPANLIRHPPWGWQCETEQPAPGDPVPFSWRIFD
jgi:hypothetical protein